MVTMSGDVMIGTVSVPLVSLLTRKTGLSGWFPIHLPNIGWETEGTGVEVTHGTRGLERVVGGLELSLKFAHHEDLEKVIHAGKGVGWAPDFDVEHMDWESEDELSDHQHQITLAVDLTSFPLQNALHAGQNQLTDKAHCYIRYKFFDRGARCSKLCKVVQNEEDYLVADVNYTKQYAVPASSPFRWYLNEELLEIQVWVTYNTDDNAKQRPRNRDKLIGSAYINLAPLADTRRRQHRISNLYALYKPGASSLGGAFLRAHVTVKANVAGGLSDSDESDAVHSPRNRRTPNTSLLRSPHRKSKHIDTDRCFAVHISLDRAFHLPIITEGGESHPPNAYMSYQTAESKDLTCTNIFPRSSNPVWNHEHDTYLDRELLTVAQKHLVFKVWHNIHDQLSSPNKGADKVLGFVSVDLVPLTTGFNQICGWYNIMDFNGSCQGQVKVAITPQENLSNTVPIQPQPTTSETTFGTLFQSTQLPHFNLHYESVKKHHRQLTDKMQEMGVNDPNAASRSLLFNSLRNNMSELDNITCKLKERLQINPFSKSQPLVSQPNHMSSINSQEPNSKFSHTEPLLDKVGTFNTQDTLSSEYCKSGALESTEEQYHQQHQQRDENNYLNSAQFLNTYDTQNTSNIPQYQRTENDNSCYTETLRNAQDTLSTAQNLIANLNHVSEHLQDQFGLSTAKSDDGDHYEEPLSSHRRQQHSSELQDNNTHRVHVHRHGHNNKHDHTNKGENIPSHPVTVPVSSSMHVHFSNAEPTIHSGELPNTSQSVYTSSGILSEAINHREVFDRGDQNDDITDQYHYGYNNHFHGNQRDSDDDNEAEDDENEEGEVMVAKPLNDVSSANFANYASMHEKPQEDRNQHRGNHSVITEEQDSWFSGAHNTSRPDEFYDTIDEEAPRDSTKQSDGVDDILKKYGVDPDDYDNENTEPENQDQCVISDENRGDDSDNKDCENSDSRHVYAFQSLASKYRVESDEEVDLSALMKHNQGYADNEADLELDPTRHKSVSRTSHDSSSSIKKSSRKAAEFRHKYNHHKHAEGSSDSEEDQSEHIKRTPRKKRSPKLSKNCSYQPVLSPGRSKSPEMILASRQQVEDLEESDDNVDMLLEKQAGDEFPLNTGTQYNPMLRTQKTIQIVWDGDKKIKQATGVDFDERSTSTYHSSQADSEHDNIQDGDAEDQFEPLTTQESHIDDVKSSGEPFGVEGIRNTHELIQESQGFPVYKSDDMDHSEGQVTDRTLRSTGGDTARSEGQAAAAHSDNNANGNNNGHVTQSDVSLLKTSAEPSPRLEVMPQKKLSNKLVPNFFLPPQDLEVTMKALRLASTAAKNNAPVGGSDSMNEEKTAAKHEVLTRLSATSSTRPKMEAVSVKSRPKPSTEQAQRIAKIFQQKFGNH